MTLRERIIRVFRGETPDVVPFMLDLSHWFYHKNQLPWDLSRAYLTPEHELIEYHRRHDIGFYMPNLGSFYEVHDAPDVRSTVEKSEDGSTITWRVETPLGTIARRRRWEEANYAWGMESWGVKTENELKVLAYAMANRTFTPRWDRYQAWVDAVGETGVVYVGAGYSAVGHLMHYWMGVEGFLYATVDMPGTLRDAVDAINDNLLGLVEMLAESPVEFVIMGDNFSGELQPPRFFDVWSRPFYDASIARLHRAGKHVAVHIDGRLTGALGMIRDTDADCADAVTPKPTGDLTPQECRDEAGNDFILSGGVPPNLWLPRVDVEEFKRSVLDWLALKEQTPRLIAAAGDQVPPYADESRIGLMRDLVEEYGRF